VSVSCCICDSSRLSTCEREVDLRTCIVLAYALTGKGWEVLEKLKSDDKLTAVKSAKEGLADMELLFGYLDVMGVLDKVSPCDEAHAFAASAANGSPLM
jgi:hypothetical protein